MKPYRSSVQLYSVREAAKENFERVLERIAAMGYVGVEFAGLHGRTPRDLRKVLDDLGIVASSCHGPLPTKENIDEVCDTAKTLGYSWHISGFGKDGFATRDDCLKTADAFQTAAGLLGERGLRFGIHNHWWEFDHEIDGVTAHRFVLQHAPDVAAQVDTYWVKFAGVDPATVVRELGKRAPLLHIKDGPLTREQGMTAVGAGLMKWKPIIDAADPSLEWLIVELDRCDTDMFEAVRGSLDYLVNEGFALKRTY